MRNGLFCFVPVMMMGFMDVGSMENDRSMFVLPFSGKEKRKNAMEGKGRKGEGCNGIDILWRDGMG